MWLSHKASTNPVGPAPTTRTSTSPIGENVVTVWAVRGRAGSSTQEFALASGPRASDSSSRSTSAVQPVWWLAPIPRPVSPSKYS